MIQYFRLFRMLLQADTWAETPKMKFADQQNVWGGEGGDEGGQATVYGFGTFCLPEDVGVYIL